MITLVDIYPTGGYDYNVQGSGSGEYSTIRPKREMTESDIEKESSTSGL